MLTNIFLEQVLPPTGQYCVVGLKEGITKAQGLIRQASSAVLGDFELGSDAKIICYPDRYMDERGQVMWGTVLGLIQKIKGQ